MLDNPDTHLIIVDPDADFLAWAAAHLKAPGVSISTFERGEDALASYVKKRADLLLSEVRLNGTTGIELLKRLRQTDPQSMVILFSGTATTSHVIEAMRLGAYDVLGKERLPYELRTVVESALTSIEARKATRAQTAEIPTESIQETIIGRSGPMQEVFKLIGRVSRSDAPVMITGESGCGKELVAGAIHKFSPRAQKEFVAINVTAIPDNLLESEIFGHEKGSFTGAVNQRVGRFEQCDGGTLFLDEIGDMPLAVQSKLLRVLQEGQYSRVGSNQTLKTDVRVLAATNKNLEDEVAKGNFREDLFYRLNVVRIHIPPLRERREDVRLLAEFFLHRLSARRRGPQMRFTDDALDMLDAYDWPGNVRELENTIQRACALCNSDVLLPSDIPLGSKGARHIDPSSTVTRMRDALSMLVSVAEKTPDIELLPWVERELSRLAYRHFSEDTDRTAKFLGINSTTLETHLSATTVKKGAIESPAIPAALVLKKAKKAS
ncbi:sigma-54 dependent transcriptional regulator [Prosthecobacter sp.]|uniref:sigma-54-dependent transcriptional regulator n=1 Tax=Prosthecobacter sp. TaxID=1965333 RepID=UPI00248756AA|nr:sigma-54 dependent transcriptional regulator [Prosthecobacter sp.]MDI1313881.1 sigma-54 dependent transcriptional regulator [Prosthecobacter sp.]